MHKKYTAKLNKEYLIELQDNLKSEFEEPINSILSEFVDLSILAFDEKPSSYKSPTSWTRKIRDILTKIAIDNEFLYYPKKIGESYKNEWLFDFVWIKAENPEDWTTSQKLILACESEWNYSFDEKLWDFMKLIYCNAKIKLFIYTNERLNPVNKFINKIADDNFYIFAGFPDKPKVLSEKEIRIDLYQKTD